MRYYVNTSKNMILEKGQDITRSVTFCKYNPGTRKYDVTFVNGKTYSYNYNSIEWIRDPKEVNPQWCSISCGGRELFNISEIFEFRGSRTYWLIRFGDGREKSYERKALEVTVSCLSEKDTRSSLEYLRRIAAINELKSDDGTGLLNRQYEKLEFLRPGTAMALYLNPQLHKMEIYAEPALIFPFGGNASQFKAVRNAMCNQVSVIQGPPGTGKTQTILNIIANLLVQGKTVQVVSNNNSATANVLEKLSSDKYGLGFLTAPLGNSSNKAEFLRNQTGEYPDFSKWKASEEKQGRLAESIKGISSELNDVFARQEKLARIRQELDSLELETRHFIKYCEETGISSESVKARRLPKSGRLMKMWQECYGFSENDRPVSLWFKIRGSIIHGISDWRTYNGSLPGIVTIYQSLFYKAKKAELTAEAESLSKSLENAAKKMEELTDRSMEFLKSRLYESYANNHKRTVFTPEDLWQRPSSFTKEYPVILSTTFSSRSSLGKDAMFDYLIMDEASQVDVATGALALSCARNAVIVGDPKQLPNVVTEDMRMKADAIFSSYNLNEGYSYSGNSFLKSVCTVIPDVPQTLLREHYRCHPKIIGFCNQKFYNNELIIMTEDKGEPDALSVLRTAAGNHRREHFNQRQIDIISKEALPRLLAKNMDDIGIIAPYNEQVNAIRDNLNSDSIDIATVHKFQGREKDTIILTSVDDVVTDFSDDPYLLNVAISRAKKRLCLVVSGNEQPQDSNIGDLLGYMEYNSFEALESKVYSVFDYLYKQYTSERMNFLRRHRKISKYDSENLMYGTIVEILEGYPAAALGVICHQPLNMLIRDPKHLSDEECRYAMNTATHVDFLVYSKITKKPAFAVEVDGFHFHKDGSRQKQRDMMKDHIFEMYGIPLLRFPTNGSGEKEIIEEMVTGFTN